MCVLFVYLVNLSSPFSPPGSVSVCGYEILLLSTCKTTGETSTYTRSPRFSTTSYVCLLNLIVVLSTVPQVFFPGSLDVCLC